LTSTSLHEIHTAADWSLRSEENLRIIALYPHILGHLIGFEKLNTWHTRWINYTWEANVPRALQAYRGGYKTTAIVLTGAIRWMLFHPNDRILLLRKKFSDAAEVVKAISRAMQTREVEELFKQAHGRYPKTVVNKEGNLTYSFKQTNTIEGNITGLGIEQGITGHHYDKIVCDDIITLRDRISRAERERTIEMVREVATNIIDPGKGSIWTGTPWHREDAWKEIRRFARIARYPISKYNFIGEEAAAKKKRTTTPYLYSANYELELGSDESLLFSDPVFGKGWNYTVKDVVGHLDTAFDGDHYCALTFAAPIRGSGENTVYQAVGFVYAGHIKDWEAKIAQLCRKYRAKYLYVETNADKGASADRLKGRGLRVKPYTESWNKHIKISTCLYDVWLNIEWAPETEDEYMIQVTEYKEGVEPDDAPDSAASLFREAYPQKRRAARAMYEW
jgi:hypothetical protein